MKKINEKYEKYWMELANAKGDLLRQGFRNKYRSFVGTDNEDYMYEIFRQFPQDKINELFENSLGELDLQNNNVYIIVRHCAFNEYSGDFNSVNDVSDEDCIKYYKWLKADDLLRHLFTNNTELDFPDII